MIRWQVFTVALLAALLLGVLDLAVVFKGNPELGGLGNGFFQISPDRVYHLALWGLWGCLFGLVMLTRNRGGL